MDLISRAKCIIDLLYAEERRGEAWTLPLETAVKHLADAHKQLEALSVSESAQTSSVVPKKPSAGIVLVQAQNLGSHHRNEGGQKPNGGG